MLIFHVFFSLLVFSQKQYHSSATVHAKVKKDKGNYPTKRLIEIKKSNTKNTYYGNECVMQLTKSFGFEYMIDCEGKKKISYFFHNQIAYIKLFFRNGPFWKIRFNRKKKFCIEQTRDFVG
jgi:hypothetical protein